MTDTRKVMLEYRLMGGEPPGLNNCLRVYEDGFCTCLIVTESYLNPKKRESEAGYYEGKVDDTTIRNLIESLEKCTGSERQEDLPCDAAVARYKLTSGRKENEIHMAYNKIPQELWNATKSVILKLSGTPVWTVSMSLFFVTAGGGQTLRITLANRGAKRVDISNPHAQMDGMSHTNLVIDGFPKQRPGQPFSYDDVDETIRWMSVPPLKKSKDGSEYIPLKPGKEFSVFRTPKELIKYAKKRPAVVIARFNGMAKAGKDAPIQIDIGSNAVDFFIPSGLGNR